YLGLGGSVGNAWGVEVEAVASAVVRGALRFEPSQDLRVITEYHDFALGVAAPLLTPLGRRTQWTTEVLARPLRGHDAMYVEGSVDRITASNGETVSGRRGLSL